MFLSDVEIEAALAVKEITIDPFVVDHLSACTIDLRINETIWLPTEAPQDYEIRPKTLKARPQESWPAYSITDTYHLEPGGFVLGETYERISIAPTAPILGFLEGRSSVARLGLLVHCSAPLVAPGYSGRITLELVNLGKHPLPLKYKDSICQIAFARLGIPSSRPSPGSKKPQPRYGV
jgi:dCTP deaminase